MKTQTIKDLLTEWDEYLKDKKVLHRKVYDSEVAIYNVDHFMFWLKDKYKSKRKSQSVEKGNDFKFDNKGNSIP